MNVLHICNDFLGSEVYSQLYKELENQISFQYIYVIQRDGKENYKYEKTLNIEKSKLIYSKKIQKFHRFFFRVKVKYLFNDLISKIDISNINITHATTLFSDGTLAYYLYKKHKIPYIVTIRSTDVNIFLKYRKDLFGLAKRILNSASSIVFVSNGIETKFSNYFDLNDFKQKTTTIGNGIDQFWLDNINIKIKENKRKYNLLYVGSLIKRKNIDKLILAVEELQKSGENIVLNIVGSKGVFSDFVIDKTKTNNNINYLGQINDKNILLENYRKNDIFILPSTRETFGLVYIEALSQGLPLIYVENEGIDGVIDLKIETKIKKPTTELIKNAIVNSIENMSIMEIMKIDFNQFSWKEIAKEYFKIYSLEKKK